MNNPPLRILSKFDFTEKRSQVNKGAVFDDAVISLLGYYFGSVPVAWY